MIESVNFRRRFNRRESAQLFREEITLRRQLASQADDDARRDEISRLLGIYEAEILSRLLASGFDATNLDALRLIPLAFTAWGSGDVTSNEFRTAIDAVLDEEHLVSTASLKMFHSWLSSRPSRELWELWELVTRQQLNGKSPRLTQADGARLYRQAKQIAMASGGFLGYGQINGQEQKVLDEIRRVYELPSQPTEHVVGRN